MKTAAPPRKQIPNTDSQLRKMRWVTFTYTRKIATLLQDAEMKIAFRTQSSTQHKT
jgi:hypothetical protein